MSTLKSMVIGLLATAAFGATGYASAQTASDTAAPSAQQSKKATHAQNRQLEKAVRHALTRTKHLDSSSIEILARNGVITLDGTVPSDDQIPKAGQAASSTPGVNAVTNNLVMREQGN
jgi:hyperosmotically inducible periplasmic protein